MRCDLPTAEDRSDEGAPALVSKGAGEAMTGAEASNPLVWRFCCCFVFLLNLIVPLPLGWPTCGASGRVGLILAVLAYGGYGLYACDGRSWWRRALVYGGGLMAASQLITIVPQFAAGLLGLGAWGAFHGKRPGPLSGPGGFFVTGVTGGILLGLALLCGVVVDCLFHRSPPHKPEQASWDEL